MNNEMIDNMIKIHKDVKKKYENELIEKSVK
jgi:hypothetical protein